MSSTHDNDRHRHSSGDAQHSIDLFAMLWQRKGLIVLSSLIGISLALMYCLVASKKYESTTQILVMNKDANLPVKSSTSSSGSVDSMMAEDILATHTQILLSPRIIGRALDEADLRSLPVLQQSVPDDETPEAYLIEQLEITRGGKGHAADAHVLNIALVHGDPQECADILSAIVSTYQSFIKQKFQDSSSDAIELIDEAREELAVDLANQEQEYREFRENASLLWRGSEVTNAHQARLMEIERSISDNRLKSAQLRSRLQTIQTADAGATIQSISELQQMALIDAADIERLGLLVSVKQGDPISESFQAMQPTREQTANAEFDRLVALRLQRNAKLQEVGAQHPRVKQLDESIRELTDFLAQRQQETGTQVASDRINIPDLMAAYRRLLEMDLNELASRHEELTALAESERGEAKKLVNDELLAESMQRKLDRTQALYDAVIDRLSEISLIKDYGGLVTEVIEPVALGRDHWPKIPLLLAVGCMVGGIFGCAGALLLELADPRFRSHAELSSTLDLPVLAHVPNITPLLKSSEKIRDQFAGPHAIAGNVISHYLSTGPAAEAFRGLRTQLMLQGNANQHAVLMVCSPTSGDGKSTLVANLAVSFAQAGKRVLVIDGDLRRPRMHQLLGSENQSGLSSILCDAIEPHDAIVHTQCEGLSLLPAGPAIQNAAELLNLPRCKELLGVLREQYDLILIDTPAVLSVSDPLVLAGLADACVLHLRLSADSRREAAKTRDLLRTSGINILGVSILDGSGGRLYDTGPQEYLGYEANPSAHVSGERRGAQHHDTVRSQPVAT